MSTTACKRRRLGLPITASRSSLPPFLTSLWDMVDTEDNNHIISWSHDGTTFSVHDPEAFELVLPTYFKHNRFTSFIRQLNMYQFVRVAAETGSWEWRHDFFRRDAPELMHNIQRRPPNHQTVALANHNDKNDLLMTPMVLPHGPEHSKSLQQRVSDLEQHRIALLSELRFEKLAQQAMQKQIETLESQIQGILNFLFKSPPVANKTPHDWALEQLLLEDNRGSAVPSSVASPNKGVDTPSSQPVVHEPNGDMPSPRFSEILSSPVDNDALSTIGQPFVLSPPADTPTNHSISTVDALMLDLDLNMERFPDLPDSLSHFSDFDISPAPDIPPHNVILTPDPSSDCKPRSIAVSDSDSSVISCAQSMMQKLLEEMTSSYKKSGLESLLPSSYDGFGCWFVRDGTGKSSDGLSNGSLKDFRSDPWAILFYGVKSKPNPIS